MSSIPTDRSVQKSFLQKIIAVFVVASVFFGTVIFAVTSITINNNTNTTSVDNSDRVSAGLQQEAALLRAGGEGSIRGLMPSKETEDVGLANDFSGDAQTPEPTIFILTEAHITVAEQGVAYSHISAGEGFFNGSSAAPSASVFPSGAPSEAPTDAPVTAPTDAPAPTDDAPTDAPTRAPTAGPTKTPTESPTNTFAPSATFMPSATFAPSTFIPTVTFKPTTD